MEKLLVINNLTQLKSVSDPFRIQLLEMLSESPKTGQMIADELNIPRSKIHYHLNELLKNEIIEVVKTEQKKSILQKFYQPVAEKIVPNIELLKYMEVEKKKDTLSYDLRIKDSNMNQFKKDLKNFVKKYSSKKDKSNIDEYTIQILPKED